VTGYADRIEINKENTSSYCGDTRVLLRGTLASGLFTRPLTFWSCHRLWRGVILSWALIGHYSNLPQHIYHRFFGLQLSGIVTTLFDSLYSEIIE
jgi:hypothetical protein